MALFNHATKELTAKIVYYGPGLCGKTSNLKILHQRLERGAGKLLSLSTAQDRTIYFDLLPIELGNIKGYTVRFQVCTVPGQVFYNETRKIVLRGVDGLVFVVDSQWSMLSHNLECFQNLKENLHEEKISFETLPVVIQYNKRDLPSALSIEALQDSLGFHSYPYVETVASEGSGVIETFKLVSKLTFVDLLRRLQRGWQPPAEEPHADLIESPAGEIGESVPVPEKAAPSATSVAAPVPPPEEAPVLVAVGRPIQEEQQEAQGEASNEEQGEAWVVPSVDGAFPELSDDSNGSSTAPAAAADHTPESPSPAATVPFAAISTPVGAEPPTVHIQLPPPPAAPAPVSPRSVSVDEKLNAVLAEARKSAGRVSVSGVFRRSEGSENSTQEVLARPETKRLEETFEKARQEDREARRRLETEIEALKAGRDLTERRIDEAVSALRIELAGEIVRLRGELAEARETARGVEGAASAAVERAHRLEEALRQALQGLMG
jgi:signal recognition particle receptor subunit beta